MSGLAKRGSDFTTEEKDRLLKQFDVSGLRYDEFAREHNINAQTFKNWVWHRNRPSGKPMRYSPIERKKIVENFIKSEMPMVDFAKTWGLSSHTLRIWLERYNEQGSDGLMDRSPKAGDGRLGAKTPKAVREEIIKLKRKEPGFGLKKIKQWMYRFRGVNVSTGTVRKTVTAEGLALVKIKKKTKKSSDRIRRFERATPMQLWQSDITQLNVGQNSMRVYLTVFMDDHSRYIVGWRLQSRQTQDLVIDAFKEAMIKYGKPQEVLTDQGRQYFAWRGKSDLEKLLEKENIKHVVSRAHHPQTLGKCERFWETVSNEFWTRIRPFDLDEARERLKYFIDHYNYQRPHQGLDGQVPADRFFKVADEVKANIEKTIKENSIRIALGELPRPPAFLIGQVGDQRIAFHGSSGKFYLTKENINEEQNNASDNSGSNPNEATGEKLSAKESFIEITQGTSGDPDQAYLAERECSGSIASPDQISNTDGVLAGSDYEGGGSPPVRNAPDTGVATWSSGHAWSERGIINECENAETRNVNG